jgi:hypothetical protein
MRNKVKKKIKKKLNKNYIFILEKEKKINLNIINS